MKSKGTIKALVITVNRNIHKNNKTLKRHTKINQLQLYIFLDIKTLQNIVFFIQFLNKCIFQF